MEPVPSCTEMVNRVAFSESDTTRATSVTCKKVEQKSQCLLSKKAKPEVVDKAKIHPAQIGGASNQASSHDFENRLFISSQKERVHKRKRHDLWHLVRARYRERDTTYCWPILVAHRCTVEASLGKCIVDR
jgi:hypothetical protein